MRTFALSLRVYPARTAALIATYVVAALAASVGASLVGASPLAAQAAEWGFEGELGGSLFFGNTSQTTMSSRLSTSRADSTYELTGQATFSYGEAEGDDGNAFVAKRTWGMSGSLNWRPYATFTPFVFGQGTSSFERRIDFRYSLGGGGKYNFVRNEVSQAQLSVALLAEQTFVRQHMPAATELDESVLARWSVNFSARRQLDGDRIVLSVENFYRPVVGEYDNYVFESSSSIAYAMSEIVSLKLSFVDTYDSKAVVRGAETNNDGQLLIGVLSSF